MTLIIPKPPAPAGPRKHGTRLHRPPIFPPGTKGVDKRGREYYIAIDGSVRRMVPKEKR